MSPAPFQALAEADETVAVTVNGVPRRLNARQSLLAALLCAGSAPPFTCAIGQCQRCLVQVNGLRQLACLTYPSAGDRIETPPAG
jgi:aerobic-type carbon monoxide dehydrogenase small subunit (CoxS/CutS family)